MREIRQNADAVSQETVPIMKRPFVLFFIAILFALPIFTVGCSDTEIEFDREGSVRVEFVLEGGTYMNSPANIVYYYKFESGTRNKIKNPAAESENDRFGKATVVRDEYTLDGWYMTKSDEGGYITYADPWDFERDKVDRKGVTLYAKWDPLIHYTYRLYRKDNGKAIGSTAYEVRAGDKFQDYLAYATNVAGFTFNGFYDEDGNPWDPDFVHPGGETDTEIKVYVDLVRGVFKEIYTKDELLNQISLNNNSAMTAYHRDIKLMADIDLGGEAFDGFRNFSKILIGNGHKISDFKLNYPNRAENLSFDPIFGDENTLPISLFGMCDNAVVSDVVFEDMTIVVDNYYDGTKKIVVAPLAVKSENSSFTNVTVKATYQVERLPSKFDINNLITVTDKGYFHKDDNSVFENIIVTVDDQINQQG